MKTILVAGGAGGVGEGIAGALLSAGHTVIIPSRSAAKLDIVRTRLESQTPGAGRLETWVAHVGEADGAEAVRDRIAREFGTLDVAIASLGGWWEGQDAVDIKIELWDEIMDEMLRPHFLFAHTFIPMLRAQPAGGQYIGIGGGAAYFPVPKASPVSIAAAAQLMLTRALRAEIADPHVDILELVVDGPVRTRDSESIAEAWWIDAAEIGTIALELVERGRSDDPVVSTRGAIVRMRPKRTKQAAS